MSLVAAGSTTWQSGPDGCLQRSSRHTTAGNDGHHCHVPVLLCTTRLQPDAAHCSLAAALLRAGVRRQGLTSATTLVCTSYMICSGQ